MNTRADSSHQTASINERSSSTIIDKVKQRNSNYSQMLVKDELNGADDGDQSTVLDLKQIEDMMRAS